MREMGRVVLSAISTPLEARDIRSTLYARLYPPPSSTAAHGYRRAACQMLFRSDLMI